VTLVQNEIELARVEVAEKVSVTTAAAKFVVSGVILIVPGIVLILFSIAVELTTLGLSQPLAYLCSGLGAVAVAVALMWVGMSRLSRGALKPSVAFEEIKRDKAMVRELIQ